MLEGSAMASALPIAQGASSTQLTGLDLIFNGQKLSTYSMMGYIYYDYETYQPVAIPNMPLKFPITIAKSDKGYKAMSNPAAKQEVLRKMKASHPITAKADKKNMPAKRSRR
jgi:hypothetical protein